LTDTEEIILVEGTSKKSDDFLFGRTGTNKIVICPRSNEVSVGDYIKVNINRSTSATLFGDFVELINPANQDIAKTA
jgi:tRNA-2-methylthio-N6-dimethylallyladenosine synthase